MYRLFVLSFLFLCLTAHSTELLEVQGGFVRGLPPGQKVTAAFAQITNTGDETLVLKSLHSTVAETVEVHSHSMKDGTMQMRKLNHFEIAAHGTAIFEPGGNHIMLLGLKKPLIENDIVSIDMCFEQVCTSIDLSVISILNESTHNH